MVEGALTFAGAATAGGIGALIGAALVVGALKNAAFAWREERDAERSKAERYEGLFADLNDKYIALAAKHEELARSRDFSAALATITQTLELLRSQGERDQRDVNATLKGVEESMTKNTAVLEFIAKQVFPARIETVPD